MSTSFTEAVAKITYTVAGTALSLADMGFTTAHINRAKLATITVRTAAVSATWVSGVTPAANDGILWDSGYTYTLVGPRNIQNLKMIRNTGTSASVTIILEE